MTSVFRAISSHLGRGQSRMATEEEVLVFLFPIAQYVSECVRGQCLKFKMFHGT